jgi:hypothetical protein
LSSSGQKVELFPQLRLDGYGKRAGQAPTDISDWLRNVVKIADDSKPFYSHRHAATSYLRNTLTSEGHRVVKEDVERYLTGHAKNGAHASYGKQWIDTLKTGVEVIPSLFKRHFMALKVAQVPVLNR